MEPVKVKIKRLNDRAIIPTRGSAKAAGYDLYACLPELHKQTGVGIPSISDFPSEAITIPTGWSFEIPDGYFGAIFARSGAARKRGLRPANCVGAVDSDYRGEVMVALRNDTKLTQVVHDGERVAQIIILPCPPVEFEEAEQLSDTERGEGGFGSTGTGVETQEHGAEQLSLFDYDDEGKR